MELDTQEYLNQAERALEGCRNSEAGLVLWTHVYGKTLINIARQAERHD